jgi:protein-tyrosine phosphatase
MTNPVVESAETTPPFTILTVCTGNICRSPLAEQLLHARLTAAGVTVTVLRAAELSTHFGGEPAAHVARLLTEELIAGADLVLTATREHRSEVVSLHPRASRYTYTLNQFARLVAQVESPTVVPVERPLDTFVAEISATRGFAPPPASPTDDDIIDPYRQSQTVYDEAGKAIDAAVRIITRALASATGRR